jgi:LuxR family maltose regulon positive regulatory protein
MTSSIRLRAWLKLWRGEISEALRLAHDAERRTAETGECRWTPFESPLLQLIGSSISGDAVATDRAMARLARQMGRPDSDLGASRNPWLMVSQLGEVEPNGVVNAWRSGYRMPGARANLVLGRDAAAAEIAASIATDKFLSFDCAVADVARPFARGMAAALRQRWAEAAHEYHEALHAQERLPLTAFFGDARIHLACVTLALGDTAAARDLMMAVVQHVQMEHAPAVLLWEPRSMILPLVRLLPRQSPQREFAEAVFAAYDKRPVHGAETPGILTARELDVLQSLATGVPNAAVAVKLGISVHTVKRHVANILAKLDVGTRGEAVAVARKRGLAD